jgi:tetratricopeptide (TPR) repeat protein
LAKLRAFFVIARGTVFALSERSVEPREAGRILNVDYVVCGVVTARERGNVVSVEMIDIRDGRIRWSEAFDYAPATASAALADIGDRIVAAVAEEVETAERNRAVLKPVESLDAWEAYHRGLWHMYRFSGEDNDRAERYFRDAIRLDPTFARAHAGLSFAHFQNAFLLKASERETQSNLAFASAGQSLLADDRDPAAHWAMGRALWLRGSQDDALHELRRCVELSPNFSLGHYTMGFVQSQSGDPHAAIESIERSRSLSPFDPMQFAMLAAASLAHLRLGNYDEAVSWSLKAAARPNAHKHIVAIAAHNLAVANRLDEVRAFATLIRKDAPRYSTEDLLAAFRFDKDTAEMIRHGGQRIGLR